jgi:uncharacterized repeat protein (TIGR01451 family)
MTTVDRLKLRTILTASGLTLLAIAVLGTATAFAICIPTVYTVTSSAPPPIGNWTDTSGAVWTPSGGFPGCAPGDTAADLNATPTTLIINSAIANPIIGLNLSCPGCTIDIQSGGSLTLAGPGSVSSSSTIIVEPGGTLTIANGGTLTFNAGTSLSVNGGHVDIQSGGALNLNGASTSTNGGVLNVNGGTLEIGALFTVQSNGTLQFTAGSVTGGNTIKNHGLIQMVGGGIVTVSPVVNNSAPGTVSVSSGTLSLAGGGTGDAPFIINSGGTLGFPSGTYNMTPNGVVSGDGTLAVSGGTLNIGGVTSPGTFSLSAGTLEGPGFLSIRNTFFWDGGTMMGSGGAELAGTGSGTLSGAIGPMLLDTRTFNNYGTIDYPATTNLLHLNNNAAFNTYGTFSFDGDGGIIADGPSSVGIFPNGLMQKHNSTGVSVIQPAATNNATVFVTSGTIEFAGNGTHSGSFIADKNGNVSTGTIAFSASSTTISGEVFGAGNISFPSGSTDFTGFSYTIGGKTTIAGATLTVDADMSTTGFQFDSGTMNMIGNFDMAGTGSWSGGTIAQDNGTFFVDAGATLTIDSANGVTTLDTAVLENDGTILYTAGSLSALRKRRVRALTATPGNLDLNNSSTIFNDGLFNIETDTQIASTTGVIISFSKTTPAGSPSASTPRHGRLSTHRARTLSKHPIALCGCPNDIQNSGTLQKTADTTTTDFGPAFSNSGAVKALAGTMHFLAGYTQTAGSTTLGPGAISVASPGTFDMQGGILDGAGTLTADIDNYGEIKPGTTSTTGVINITGNYNSGPPSIVSIKLAGPAAGQFDQVNITGTATLDGTFNATFLGGYIPTTGTAVWQVITYASHSGSFATQNLPTYSTGTVTSAYNPTSFDLTAVTPPSADLKLVMNGPATVNAGAPLSYTISVSNLGPDPSSGTISVADTLPAGVTGASGSGTGWSCGAPSGGVITCTTPGPLATGPPLPALTMAMTAPVATGNITNSATVSDAIADANPSNNTNSVTTNVGPQANLSITKSGPASVNAGQNIVYTITVTNAGPTAATGTVVSDPTPVGIAFLSNSNGCTTPFPCNLGTLNPSQSVTITSTYNVPNSYSGSSVSNTATVSSAVNDPNLTDNSATATTTVVAGAGNADVSVTKSGPPSVTLGSNISYTITVTNSGPAAANNTFADDATPPGLTFVGNTGACSGPFPCALGTLASGQSVVITATYNVPANYSGTTISNTATVSTSSPETNTANNSSTVATPISTASVADLSVTKTGPGEANPNNLVDFTVIVTNNGPGTAPNTIVNDPTPAGLTFISNSGACATVYPCLLGSILPGHVVAITSRYRVSATGGSITNTASAGSSATDPVPSNSTASASMIITPGISCPTAPAQTAPAQGATVASPLTLSWHTVSGATGYTITINGPSSTQTFTTNTGSITLSLSNGAYSWSVQAIGAGGCTPASSGFSNFNVCNTPGIPIPSVVALSTTGQTYTVAWTSSEGATLYELQESADAAFSAPTSTMLAGTSQTFTRNVQGPTPFFYRVRVAASCNPAIGAFSSTASIIVIPLPAIGSLNPNIPVPTGSTQPVTFPIHVNGVPGQSTSFVATVDKPWLAVTPGSGIMPPEGLTFLISADPSTLTDGTWTGTVIIVFGTGVVGGKQALGTTPPTSIPVSISLTSPVTAGPFSTPASTALVIPSVGHLAGLGSQWQSDIRIANTSALFKTVQLIFNGGSATSTAVKSTVIAVAAGATVALDDVVRNWYGVGATGDSSNGVLTVQPLDAAGKPDVSINKSTVISSRTFNASAAGTLGQFIPAVPLANFISKAPGAVSILALQQIAQSDTFRTNLGLVEAIGKPVNLLVSVFDGAGSKLLDLPAVLGAAQQLQLNAFLAGKGITLTNGHIEVSVTSGDGKATAYASVVDDRSTDPLLVSGFPLGGVGATRFVVPGVASLNTGAAWKSDVRIFNGSVTPSTAHLTFYPIGFPSSSAFTDVTIQPGQVLALDDIVHAVFLNTNAAGALHVTTAVATPLIVTARTYDDTPGGTLGQFVQAVTPADGVGSGDRSLQLLQMEDSPRYRTNLGIAEITGNPVTAEVTVVLPDSKVAPKVNIPLGPFESRQFAIISSLGLGNVYNARISVRVIDGQGKVTAYGSVIDQKTQDPTFVPAQ